MTIVIERLGTAFGARRHLNVREDAAYPSLFGRSRSWTMGSSGHGYPFNPPSGLVSAVPKEKSCKFLPRDLP